MPDFAGFALDEVDSRVQRRRDFPVVLAFFEDCGQGQIAVGQLEAAAKREAVDDGAQQVDQLHFFDDQHELALFLDELSEVELVEGEEEAVRNLDFLEQFFVATRLQSGHARFVF